MAMKTWHIDFNWKNEKHSLIMKAGEKDVTHLRHEIGNLMRIHSSRREITNHGAMMVWSSSGNTPPKDEAAWKLDLTRLMSKLVDHVAADTVLTAKQVKELSYEFEQAFKLHVGEIDKRTTPEEDAEDKAERTAAYADDKAKQAARTLAWATEWGNLERSPLAALPEGALAITLQMVYDGSHYQSDYFNTHAHVGDAMILDLVGKQAETERLARQAVGLFPELSGVRFEWFTQKYSMGHGNYLRSEVIGQRDVGNTFGVVDVRWEVEFTGRVYNPIYYFRQSERVAA